jgi:hypothetical protein
MTHLVVTPELHTNMIQFMGMTTPKEYLAYNIIGDKYIAIKYTNRQKKIQTWSMTDGKIVDSHDLSGINLSNYNVHLNKKQGRVLLS